MSSNITPEQLAESFTYIFADRTAKMNHYTVTASKPSEAIKHLVMEHGQQPYRIVNIIRAN